MINKVAIALFFILLGLNATAQKNEQNRIVYNRLEYFFNLKQTDSIYALADENFKKNISAKDFNNFLNYYYQLGTIKDAKQVSEDENIIGYNLDFKNNSCYLQLRVDSNYRFNLLAIKDKPYVTVDVKEIQSNITKNDILDFAIDSIAKTYLTNPNTASLAIGIINNRKTSTFFYGETIKGDKNSLPNINSMYEVGSITKIFTSILLANLVEKNIIGLEDSIYHYLPDSLQANPNLRKITFKQLANHTSGLPCTPTDLEKSFKYNEKNPYANYNQKDLYHYLQNVQLLFEPGEDYAYSNLAFGLLGELINTISGKSYIQNVKDVITTPLNLTATVDKIDPKSQRKATVYNKLGESTPLWDFQALSGAGALKSNIDDLLRFAQYQFKMPETELERAMALTRQFTYYLPPNTDIGLGWHMNLSNDVTTYSHFGQTGGSFSYIAVVPDLKSAVIVLSNSAISIESISEAILEKILNTK